MKNEQCNQQISDAIQALMRGDPIVYPTDTLYALGADIFNIDAINFLFTLKQRPHTLPLPVAVADVEMMTSIAAVSDYAHRLIDYFLPGPLTLILPKKQSVSDRVTGGHPTIAVRIPDNAIALDLLSSFGPLTVTSANIHTKKTPEVIKDIMMLFTKNVAVYIDDGRLDGKPSTILDVTQEKPRIVRQGKITHKQIMDAM